MPNGRHLVWQLMRRARLSVFQGRASDSKNSPHPNEPFTGQDMLYSRPKYALNHRSSHKMEQVRFQLLIRISALA